MNVSKHCQALLDSKPTVCESFLACASDVGSWRSCQKGGRAGISRQAGGWSLARNKFVDFVVPGSVCRGFKK